MWRSAITNEIDFYLKTVRLDCTADFHKWWSANAIQYQSLTKFAKIYLTSPGSSEMVRGYFQKQVLFMTKSAIVCYQKMLKK